MSNLINGLLERRSIRKYEDKPVPREMLELIVKAGSYAPSAGNAQAWHFTVIQNADVIRRITEALKNACRAEGIPDAVSKFVNTPEYTVNYGAPVLIIISGALSHPLSICDCTLAAGNMMLASHALGFGSCWINQPSTFTRVPEFRALLSELGVPPEYDAFASVCLGHAANANPRPAARKAGTANYID